MLGSQCISKRKTIKIPDGVKFCWIIFGFKMQTTIIYRFVLITQAFLTFRLVLQRS